MNDILVVFQAEFMRRITSRPFIMGLLIGVIAVFGLVRLPALMTRLTTNEVHRVVLVGDPSLTKQAKALLSNDYAVAATVASASDDRALMTRYDAGQIIVLARTKDALAVTVYARDPANVSGSRISRDLLPLRVALLTSIPQQRINRAFALPVVVKATGSKFASSGSAEAAHGVVFLMIFALYIVALVNSQLVMSSVAEEKTSRIAEMLVAAMDPTYLLAGKILAAAALAFVQLAAWLAVGIFLNPASDASANGAAAAVSMNELLGVLTPSTIVLFLVLFLIGLLQLATMFAGVASMINRTEDIGSLSGPLVIPVVLAMFAAIAALDVPDAPWAVVCSFIPIISPFVLFARIGVSNVPALQIALALLVNIAALVATAYASGKIYRVGMLLYGRSPSLAQAWKALRS